MTVAEVGTPVALTGGGQLEIPISDLTIPAETAETCSYRVDLGAAAPLGINTRRVPRAIR